MRDIRIVTLTPVYCDEDGWTVIQSRGQFGNPIDYFYRYWEDYAAGFGEPGREHWLGLRRISYMTRTRPYTLRMVMVDQLNNRGETQWTQFVVADEADKFRLQIGGYNGGMNGDGLANGNGMQFSTRDNDNDSHAGGNCALSYYGGGWHTACLTSNINGHNYNSMTSPYAKGIVHNPYRTYFHSMKSAHLALKLP